MTPQEFTERCLLGVLMRHPERIGEVGPQLTGGDFADDRHAAQFTLIREHAASLTQLAEQARTAGRQPELWAADLTTAVPELAHHNLRPADLAAQMELAPPGGGQPAIYAELVMEASIRRQITQLGYEAAQFSAHTPQLTELLAAHEAITTHLDIAQQRWEAITHTRDVTRALSAEPGPGNATDVDLLGHPALPTPTAPPPTAAELHAAQEQVIGAILQQPGAADALLGRLEPHDFLDAQLGNALQAAKLVHAQAAVTNRQVDPVTVAWVLQSLPEDHGPTPPPRYLHDLAATTDRSDLDTSVDLVMRASLAKLTADAAATAHQAAELVAVAPADMLAMTRSAYQAVDQAAHRMTGRTTTDYRLSVRDNRAASSSRSAADLTDLRSRSATLVHAATTTPSPPDPGDYHGIGARLDTAADLSSTAPEQEVQHDAEFGPT